MSLIDRLGAPLATSLLIERSRQTRLLLLGGLAATPPSAPLLSFIVRNQTTPTRALAWAIGAPIAAVLAIALTALQGRYRPHRLGLLAVPAFLIGATWGLCPFVLSVRSPIAQVLVIMVVVVVNSVGSVMTSPTRRGFFAMTVPLLLIGTLWLVQADSPEVRSIAPLSAALFVVCFALHRTINSAMRRSLEASFANQQLAADLSRQQGHIEEVNAALVSANELLTQRVTEDSLTGLLNRRGLFERLDDRVVTPSTGSLCGTALLYLDLDHFKVVNDSLGHLAGDRLLQVVANRLSGSVATQRSEVAVSRLGGDEFCVAVSGLGDVDEAVAIGQRLCNALRDPIVVDGRDLTINVSVGVAVDFDGAIGSEDLLRFADAALYQAKQSGRNQVAVFDAAMRATIARRLDDASELRSALDGGLIVPWYQPIYDLRSGKLVGAESLARWLHHDGVRSAGSFMALAEEVGLELTLSDAMVNQSFAQRVQWHVEGVPAEFVLNTNVCAQQLCSPAHLASTLEFLDRTPLVASALTIEVTETSLIADMGQATAALSALRARGMKVALDDFGTGYSSLSLLQRLPLDSVKIDRSFISDITHNRHDRALVRAVLELAQGFGLTVTAEGVETVEQAELLRALGCERAQGFLYSPAVPPSNLFDPTLVERGQLAAKGQPARR
jgi:diguanylate cyclase (GGDEF)-like protein